MRLSLGNMTLELNIFNLQRQPSRFDDMHIATLNLVEDYMFDDEFGDMLVAEYKSFLIDDEHRSNVFEFGDLCSTVDCLIASTFSYEFDSPLVSLEFMPLPNSLKCSFWTQ